MTDHTAWIILNLLTGIGPARSNMLAEFCGSASAIFEQEASTLAQIHGISTELANKLVNWEKHVDLQRELETAESGGVTILTPADEKYPAQLRNFRDAPVTLYVRGTLPPELGQRSLAMVGTRNATNYGARMARHIAESAAYAGWVTISGLAVGIDTIVHRATVDAGGKTVAVLGGGFSHLHPAENVDLARDIIAGGGAIITEYPIRMSPTRQTFPMRNRIISGLSCGTLVVEAGVNSGSLITAAHALEQGRHVFALPGEADNPSAAGCNQLIRQGATLVSGFEEILQEFDFLPGMEADRPFAFAEEEGNGEMPIADASADTMLSPDDQEILNVLRKGSLTIDAISEKTDLPAGDVVSAMIALEILHRVRKNPDGSYSRLR